MYLSFELFNQNVCYCVCSSSDNNWCAGWERAEERVVREKEKEESIYMFLDFIYG